MSDQERCQATAARYARLAEFAADPQKRRAYRDLERLWRELAVLVAGVDLTAHAGLRDRLQSLADEGDLPQQRTLH